MVAPRRGVGTTDDGDPRRKPLTRGLTVSGLVYAVILIAVVLLLFGNP